MLDALLFGLDVSVQHGGVGGEPHFVGRPRDIEPLLAADFVVADDFPDARIENLRAAAGERVHTRFLQGHQRVADGKLGDAREVADLDHGERFQVDPRAALLESAHQVEEILERQIGVQAADQMELRGAFAGALFGALVNFFEREGVSTRSVRVAAKRAQPAMGHADVGRIDVPVDVVIAHVPVAFFADGIRQPAHGQQARRAIERDSIVEAQPLSGKNLIGNGLQLRVVYDQFAHFESAELFILARPTRQRPRRAGTTD